MSRKGSDRELQGSFKILECATEGFVGFYLQIKNKNDQAKSFLKISILKIFKQLASLDRASVEYYILVGDLTFALRPLLTLVWRLGIT